ncbi:hypothetical protein P168DRAFT_328384 [Aspergillus campestris IBT 28561]|uniref:Mid2 domain-containing protein n=1 Tax=Aspergillus campestris (strain IBT 28561) TaxID=1392248 RepID=A0A2I1D0E7_ASPC2|nr:uncharacterized protein P168DRAFT_328384 [Aspergillus campestris IBT 28561]PKY03350.1 hypothetical protein P168DRAFT_328384 [Aspergillus campestris IBT 28561]
MGSCFRMKEGKILRWNNDVPCAPTNAASPYAPCCLVGHYCLSNNICNDPYGLPGLKFYNADCSDPTMQDPSCVTRCGGRNTSFLTYLDETSARWACCTRHPNGDPDCAAVSDDQFPGPRPEDLTTIAYISKDGSASYAPTSSPTATGGSRASATAAKSTSSSGIGAGAAAGIGVGVGLAVFIVAATVAFIYFRKKWGPKPVEGQHGKGAGHDSAGQWVGGNPALIHANGQSRNVLELDKTGDRPRELDGRYTRELE